MQDDISFHWTADQPLAVVEFLEDLAERIWSRYGFAIRGGTLGPGPPAKTPQLTLPFPSLSEQALGRSADLLDRDAPW